MSRCAGGAVWIALLLAGCAGETSTKLDELNLTDNARAALSRQRFAPLRLGDRVEAGDVILCGEDDRVLLAFSKRLMVDYLGIDASFLIPELFPQRSESELYLLVPAAQLMRLFIPPGIGTQVPHPEARVRELSGSPKFSSDLRAVEELFDERQIFARTTPTVTATAPAAPTPTPTATAPEAKPEKPRRLGISPFPRMGPKSGVVIERVLANGPASRSKLNTGDKIVAVNGKKVGDIYELKAEVEGSHGPEVVLSVRRRGSKGTETVTVSFP